MNNFVTIPRWIFERWIKELQLEASTSIDELSCSKLKDVIRQMQEWEDDR